MCKAGILIVRLNNDLNDRFALAEVTTNIGSCVQSTERWMHNL